MSIAKEYGRPPHEVENEWPVYWLDRAAVKMEGETIYANTRADRLKKEGARRRK